MIETTVGQLAGRELFASLPAPHPARQSHPFREYGGEREDLNSERGFEDEDMGELSDSPSSYPSHSRPTTPSHSILPDTPSQAAAHRRNTPSPPGKSSRSSSPHRLVPGQTTEPFTLAHKAERILGLTPGTLAHARACLENARDEVRRLADSPVESSPPSSFVTLTGTGSGQHGGAGIGGMKGKIDRARKAMSVALPGGAKVPSVVVGAGGEEEEERRERRRRAADGVIYWQKEVGRLEGEEGAAMMTAKSRRKVRAGSPR